MLLRLFVFLIIIVAIVAGVLALTLSRDQIVQIIQFRDFFDVALPILAFGALFKYLCTFRCCNCRKN
jgi:hypothetical protein